MGAQAFSAMHKDGCLPRPGSGSSPSTSLSLSRRRFLGALAAAPWLAESIAGSARVAHAAEDTRYLIAHRGGIVDETHPENSPSSVEAAIERGYWMIEVDVRRTRDGRPIVQHDPTFDRFYGVSRKVDEMTWDEASALRATPGGTRPMTFDELCERCAGRIRLMLDIKGDYPAAFMQDMLASLRRHRLLDTTISLSGGNLPELSGGIVAKAANRAALAAAVQRGEPVAQRYFLFEIASVMNEESVALARKHGVMPVAAINTFRYKQAGVDDHQGAQADATRLLALGVRHFQLDSIYDRYLRG